jgi:hypothetical protein
MSERMQDTPFEELRNMKGRASGRFGSSPVPSESDASLNQPPSPVGPSSKDAFGLVLTVSDLKPIWQLESLFCYKGTWKDDRLDKGSGETSDSQEVILTIATGLNSINPLLTSQNPEHL